MEQFCDPRLNFIQRNRISNDTKNLNKIRQDFLSPLQLGKIIPEHKFNWYELQYGHNYMNNYPDATIFRPPPPSAPRPVSLLLNHTNNMLVDVFGTLYHNKDLKVSPVKKLGKF
jgi:hypothetical protein